MTTEDFVGAVLKSNKESYELETGLLYQSLVDEAIVRRVFPAPSFRPVLKNHQTTFRIHDIFDDLKTNYGMKAAQFPVTRQSLRPREYDVPKIFTKLMSDKDELAVINDGLVPFSARVQRAISKIAEDEDMYGIAGEATENGVSGISDVTASTGFSTAAGTQLDLTTLNTLKTTLKTMIQQVNSGLRSNKRGVRDTGQAPLILLLTNDVYDRAIEVSSGTAANDETISDGVDMMNNLLNKYGAPGSGVEKSNMLGATVSRVGNAFEVSTDGSTNAALMSSHPLHFGVATSLLRQTPAIQPNGDIEFELDERFVPYSVIQEASVYSATVDITA